MTVPCDFEHLPREVWTWFPVEKGAKRRKVRCPKCNKRLRVRTIYDHQDGVIVFYRIPPHKVTAPKPRKKSKQLRLPGMR